MKDKNNFKIALPYVMTRMLGYLVSMISIPLLTSIFSKDDYGVISTLEASISLLVSLFLFGIPQSYIRFYSKYKKSDELNQLDSSYFRIVAILAILSFCISLIFFTFFLSVEFSIIYLSLGVSFAVILQLLSAIIRGQERTFLHACILGLSDLLYYIVPVISVLVIGASIDTFFISQLFSPFLLIILVLFKVKNNISFNKHDLSITRNLLLFGIPLVLLSFGSTLLAQSDKIIINLMIGSEEVAVYAVASKISHAIQQLLIFPIAMVLFPMYTRIWEEEGSQKTSYVLSNWFEKYSFISIPIIAGSFIIRKNLILLLSNELYMDAAILIPLLTGGLLIYGAYYFISAGFFLSNKTKNLGYLIIIISFLNIILSLILGKIIGVLGVTISTVVSYIIFMLATYFLGKKTLTLKIDYTILLNFSLKSIVMIIIVRLIPVVDLNILSLIIKILVSVFIYLLLNVGYIKKNIMGGKKQW